MQALHPPEKNTPNGDIVLPNLLEGPNLDAANTIATANHKGHSNPRELVMEALKLRTAEDEGLIWIGAGASSLRGVKGHPGIGR